MLPSVKLNIEIIQTKIIKKHTITHLKFKFFNFKNFKKHAINKINKKLICSKEN